MRPAQGSGAKSAATPAGDAALFDGGPPMRLQRLLGLLKPRNRHVVRRAIMVALVTWCPPLILSAFAHSATSWAQLHSFVTDISVHARFLIAAPLLILAETVCISRLSSIALHFVEDSVVRESEIPRFNAVCNSIIRLRDSTAVEVATVVVAYALVGAIFTYAPDRILPTWHVADGSRALSPAGWWAALVSLPILFVLVLGWLWRLFLWARFLVSMAEFDLVLIPPHPDHAAGLKFVGYSLRAFSVVGLALGTIAAGSVATQVLIGGRPLSSFAVLIASVAGVIAILFTLPLLAFSKKLLDMWERGVFEYGALARRVGDEFDRRWVRSRKPIAASSLEVSDFSATTDLYQVVGNVYGLRIVPVDMVSIGLFVGATLLPFGVVAIAALPFDVILKEITSLVL
jgi:hypothetical protein